MKRFYGKGNADCHIPSDKYRANYDSIFRKEKRNVDWYGTAGPEWAGWDEIEEMVKQSGERLLNEEYPIWPDKGR